MAGELSYLDQFTGETPPRSVWTRLLDEVRQRVLRVIPGGRGETESRHPWQASAGRWEDEAADSYGIDPNRLWRIDLVPGCVNQRPATLGGKSLFVAQDAPFFVIEAPDAAGKSRHFRKVSDAQRPEWFRTEERWALDLYRAVVTVRGQRPPVPDVLLNLPVIPPSFTLTGLLTEVAIMDTLASIGVTELPRLLPLQPPFTLSCGAAPVDLALPFPAVRLLADVWLTRDRKAGPDGDEIAIGQHECYDLAAFSVLDGAALLGLAPALEAQGLAGELTAQALFTTLFEQARCLWWSAG